MLTSDGITGSHKTQLLSDLLHSCVVLIVVVCVTILASLQVGLPPDVIGTVYGGAIGYAAGRAGNVSRASILMPGPYRGYADVEPVPFESAE